MNMKTILAAALTAGFFVQPCMTALASVSAPESDKNQIGPGFEAPAEENAESAFTPWTKVDGVHVTPYVYLQTRTVEEAEAAARYAVDVAKNYDVSYPLAVDIESQYILDLSTQELTDIANAFCRVVAEAGYTPIVYSDYHKFTTEMDTNQIPYDIWLARYGGDHNYPNRTMWQATDKGVIDGINGNVCLEFAFKDYAPALEAGDATPGQWKEENGVWYFENNGGRYTGWIRPDGNWYYMDPAAGGAMVSNTSMVIDGVTYSFNGSGVMQ